jgi:hypothetical protein
MKDRNNTDDIADSEIELEPFDQPVETDPTAAVEEAEPYFPPTDPVVRTDHAGETQIASGFSSGESPADLPPAAVGDTPSDEALEDLVAPGAAPRREHRAPASEGRRAAGCRPPPGID